MMTYQDLAELAAIVERMTPGPWRCAYDDGAALFVDANDDSVWSHDDENAEAIVALRNAAPALIAELRELREYRDRRCETCVNWYDAGPGFFGTCGSHPTLNTDPDWHCADWTPRQGEP